MSTKLHPLKVKEVRRETPDCVSVSFDVPEELRKEFEFTQGQYLTLEADVFGEPVRRAYSLCCSPLDDEWRVAIKKVYGGKFSTFANEALVKGDTLRVMAPQGNFHTDLSPENEKHYLAFAAGSGITPVLSILKSVLAKEPKSEFTLVYGNKGFSSVIFFEELEAMKNRFLGRLTIHHIFSRETLDMPMHNGRIDVEKLNQFSKGLIDFESVDEVFICGPLSMTQSLSEALPAKGISKEHIHVELFNSGIGDEKEVFKPSISKQEEGKEALVKITLDGKTIQFPLAFGGGNILDAALKKGADLPFACKGGVCSTCRAKLVSGEVEMEVNYALEPDELEAGFILTCQSHPRSDSLTIDFDQK